MPQYRVLKKSYIHDRLYEPGEIVDWDGPQGTNLEPIGSEKRPPEPSRITGMPGPDIASPPPQSAGKSEYDEGGPNRQTALREYDEKRLADQEPDVLPTEPQVLARRAEAEGAQAEAPDDPDVQKRAESAAMPLDQAAQPVEKPATTSEGPKRKK